MKDVSNERQVFERSERLHAVDEGLKIAYRSPLRLLLEHPCYCIVKILVEVLSRRSLLKDVSHENKVSTLVREASRGQWASQNCISEPS